MKVPDVHSVRYRIKKLERVIEKIIRKRIEDPDRIIDLSNYTKVITDLIGIRALHLFKDNWQSIIILYPQPGIYMKLLLHIIGMEILKKL